MRSVDLDAGPGVHRPPLRGLFGDDPRVLGGARASRPRNCAFQRHEFKRGPVFPFVRVPRGSAAIGSSRSKIAEYFQWGCVACTAAAAAASMELVWRGIA